MSKIGQKFVGHPNVLESDNLMYFDVDETLILWDTYGHDDIIKVIDPYIDGKEIELVTHQRNIDLLKRNHGQGRAVVVWSAGGYKWAETIVYALGIEKYVDLIIPKPSVYVDDIPMEQWNLSRVYLNYKLPPNMKE